MQALLMGKEPGCCLGYGYTDKPPYEAVVIGSLELGELVRFRDQRVLEALAAGLPVVLYAPGLPEAPKNRALSASLASARRELKNWGVVFTEGAVRHVITAQQARQMRELGQRPAPGAVLTPLAKEILE